MSAVLPKKPLGFRPKKVANATVAKEVPAELKTAHAAPPSTDTMTPLPSAKPVSIAPAKRVPLGGAGGPPSYSLAPTATATAKPKKAPSAKKPSVARPTPAPKAVAIEAKPHADRLTTYLEDVAYPTPEATGDDDNAIEEYAEQMEKMEKGRERIERRVRREDALQAYRTAQDAYETQNHYLLDTAVFMPATRRAFYPFIQTSYASIFGLPPRDPDAEVDPLACQKLMDAGKQAVETFLYQRFVKEYIRQASPYRGILIYHGLGSGKTCSSIAAAEALYGVANKKIIVMTPFSLRANFIREVTFCGFRHFSLNNHWVQITAEYDEDRTAWRFHLHHRLYAESVLSLSEKYLNALVAVDAPPDNEITPTIWIPNFTKAPNYDTLSPTERDQIRNQINESINNRIQFINYNGVRAQVLKDWACEAIETGKTIFDDAVIVIDEVHNLIRLMQGAIDPFLKTRPGRKRKIEAEPVQPGTWKPKLCTRGENYNRAFLFYRLLCGAKNTKIVGLSGTPIINFPEELGILSNVLGGYIDSFSIVVPGLTDATKRQLTKLMDADPRTDLVHIKGTSGAGTEIVVSIFQEGYVKVLNEAGEFQGVKYEQTAQESIQEIYARIKTAVRTAIPTIRLPDEATYTSYPRLPPDDETFRGTFISQATNGVMNEVLLKKRLTGLISYYKGSKEEFMPKVIEDTLERCVMSEYMLEKYIEARNAEIKKEMQKEKGEPADLFALVEMFAKSKNPSSYRFRSRAICNFVFPKSIQRPFPEDTDKIDMETKAIEEIDMGDRMPAGGDDAYTIADQIELEGQLEEDRRAAMEAAAEDDAVTAEMPPAPAGGAGAVAAMAGEVIGDALAATGDVLAGAAEGAADAASAVAGAIQSILPGAEVAPVEAVNPGQLKQFGGADGDSNSNSDSSPESVDATVLAPTAQPVAERPLTYEELIARAMSQLRANRLNYLRLDADAPQKRLEYYSPKLASILRRIAASPGPALVYSQFKTVEGLGVLGISLEANAYEEIKLSGRPDVISEMRLSPETIASIKKGPRGANRYITFSGEGTKEQRAVTLAIFNGNFAALPRNIASVFEEYDATVEDKTQTYAALANRHGEICKVIGITGAGAEGISLKCVRQVHIMEPYWNMVRLDQVKGRAIRICSHADLPPEERNVSIYTYVSVFSAEQIASTGATSAIRVDHTILLRDQNMTSDENVYQVSSRKQSINEALLKVMKEAAVDCRMNSADNESDLSCFVTDTTNPNTPMFFPDLATDRTETAATLAAAPAPATATATAGEASAISSAALAPAGKRPAPPVLAQTITIGKAGGEKTTYILRKKSDDAINEYYLLPLNSVQLTRPIAVGEIKQSFVDGKFSGLKMYPEGATVELDA